MSVDVQKGNPTIDYGQEAAAAVETFERYHTEDLAAGTYTPGDEGLFSVAWETLAGTLPYLLDSGANQRYPLQNTSGNSCIIGDGANLSFRNAGAQQELVVMRHYISTGTYERYNTQDLAAAASYTPADEGLFSHASEQYVDVVLEYKYNANWWFFHEYSAAGNDFGTLLAIGDGSRLRYRNTNGANARWYVCMRAIMVT